MAQSPSKLWTYSSSCMSKEQKQSVVLLAGAGCDTAAHCAEDRTALMMASMGTHNDIVAFLLQLPCFS